MAAAPSPTRALETGGAGSQAYFYFKESPLPIPTPYLQSQDPGPRPFPPSMLKRDPDTARLYPQLYRKGPLSNCPILPDVFNIQRLGQG